MAKIIAIMNEKGGVGKTTTAVEIAYLLAKKEKTEKNNVLLIDFDAQANATISCGAEITEPLKVPITIYELLKRIIEEEDLPEKSEYIKKTNYGLDLIPSNRKLSKLSDDITLADFREKIFKRYINTIKDDYKYIIIDCMPSINNATKNIMMGSDYILIPEEHDIFAIQGTGNMLKTIKQVQVENEKLKILGIVKTKVKENISVGKFLNDLLHQEYGDKAKIFETIIPLTVKVEEAHTNGISINEYSPNERIAESYRKLVDEILIELEKE